MLVINYLLVNVHFITKQFELTHRAKLLLDHTGKRSEKFFLLIPFLNCLSFVMDDLTKVVVTSDTTFVRSLIYFGHIFCFV